MSKSYEFREPTGWAEAVAEFDQKRLDDGEVIVLHGSCPRCEHFMDVELPIALQTGGLGVTEARDEQVLTERPRFGTPEPRSFTKTALCNCQEEHTGRPKDVTEGCGAFGTLKVG